jgi:hypothetical protein
MPGRDGKGPLGKGSLTGRGFGPCGRGAAFGRGFGGGRVRGTGPVYQETANLSKEEQKKILEAELKEIAAEKQEIENKLKELRK